MPRRFIDVGEWDPLHFIFDIGSQKNVILAKVIKRLKLPLVPHAKLYTINWLSHEWHINVNQQCHLSYGINPFKYEVLYDVSPLKVCDVILSKNYR